MCISVRNKIYAFSHYPKRAGIKRVQKRAHREKFITPVLQQILIFAHIEHFLLKTKAITIKLNPKNASLNSTKQPHTSPHLPQIYIRVRAPPSTKSRDNPFPSPFNPAPASSILTTRR